MIPELRERLVDRIGKYTSLRKVAAGEFAGPCPRCGGRDRFRVNEKKGWFCRTCQGEPGSVGHWGDYADFTSFAFGWGLKETLKSIGADRKITPEELARLDEERQQRQAEERKAEAEKQAAAHDQLTSAGEWQAYAQHPQAVEMWQARGVSQRWQEYYCLGYSPSRTFGSDKGPFNSASLTIPYFRPTYTQNPEGGADVTWRVIGLQHRLLCDNPPGGKYRPHVAGAGKHLFWADLFQQGNTLGDLLIVEGEIKTIITWAALWIDNDCIGPNITVVGVPGKGWRQEWVEVFNRADTVTICLDPDATTSANKLAQMIGDKARVLLLPDKIDDLINMGIVDGFKLLELMVR